MAFQLPKFDSLSKGRWGLLASGIAIVVVLIFLIFFYQKSIFVQDAARTWIVLVLALAIILVANRGIFYSSHGNNHEDSFVAYAIAFNAVIFIVIGLSAVVIACKDWAMPVLIAGGSLLIGSFFGLLFGYPSGAVQQPKPGATQAQTSAAQDKNLLAESASTLGKVIAGFTLAKASQIWASTSKICHALAFAFGADAKTNYLMAFATLVYFLAVGFLAGLLLPSYFMAGVFAAAQTNDGQHE